MIGRSLRLPASLLLLLVASPLGAALPTQPLHRLKAMQQQLLMREPAERAEVLERRLKEWRRHGAKSGRRSAGMRRRPEGLGDLARGPKIDYFARARTSALNASAAPPNRLVNDTLGEPVGSCQSEVSIASFGDRVVAAWNDGVGIYNGTDTQGFAYSSDGGLTWTDGGVPPVTNIGQWSSDPVVVVNEKTGAFYYCGLADQLLAGTNGIGVVKGTFSGSAFGWGTPTLAVAEDGSTALLDKQWMAVDSLSGNLYISYSHFSIVGGNFTSDEIRFIRSADDNQTWSSPMKLSAGVDDGYVQGSRPAVGPTGELYVVWHAIGQPTVNTNSGRDFLRIRRSTSQGASWDPEATVDSLFSNFSSGAPGFNRPIGITFPAIAVDRSSGPDRGRVYVAWNEALNFYADVNTLPIPGQDPALTETEPNNGSSAADPFVPGTILRGVISVPGNPGDHDYWRWNAVQGTTYFFWADSIDANLDLSFRIFCTDGTTNLAFNQNGSGTTYGGELLIFTAPTTGPYYVRVASYGGQRTGRYRIRGTTHQIRGDDLARGVRDHRDIFVKSSLNGTVWGPTRRVNDSPGYFDDFLPEVAVDGRGRVFVADYDWRDATTTCGGASNAYLYRSDNGGGSWIPGTPMSDFTTDWNVTYSTLIPNQGDYIGLFARDSTVFVAWSDGRNQDPSNADPDIYMTSTTLSCNAAPVTPDGIAASVDGDSVTVAWGVPDGMSATLYRRVGSGSYADLGPVVATPANQIVYVDAAVAPGNTYSYRLGVTGFCQQYVGEQSVSIPSPVPPALAILRINQPPPNDIDVQFALHSTQPATLALYDIAGRKIQSMDVTAFGPGGPHVAKLYSGPRLGAGVYFVQLSQGGSSEEKKISVFK